jgi:hypothetical protein
MVMGVDDFLEAVAAEAAAAIAEAVAKQIVTTVLGFLSSKDDIAQAIAQIEAYIGKQFDDFRNDNLIVNTFAAKDALQEYQNNPGNPVYLNNALGPLDLARQWLEQQIVHDGEDFLRQRYVEVVSYALTDYAVWYARAALDAGDIQNLRASINRTIDYLSRSERQIQLMESVFVSGITDTVDQDEADMDNKNPIAWYHSSFRVNCRLNPDGTINPAGGYNWDAGPSRADVHYAAVAHRNDILTQYALGEKDRQARIYGPIQQIIDSMRNGPLNAIIKLLGQE